MAPAIYHQLVANAIAEAYEGNLDISSNQLRRTALTDRRRIFRGGVSIQPRDPSSLRPTPTAPHFANRPSRRLVLQGALRVAARLLHKGPRACLVLFLCSTFYLQTAGFLRWACLDSNQGPLPYQRSALTG